MPFRRCACAHVRNVYIGLRAPQCTENATTCKSYYNQRVALCVKGAPKIKTSGKLVYLRDVCKVTCRTCLKDDEIGRKRDPPKGCAMTGEGDNKLVTLFPESAEESNVFWDGSDYYQVGGPSCIGQHTIIVHVACSNYSDLYAELHMLVIV